MDRDRDLVVMKFREEKETLESFFKSLAERVETIQTTQTQEVGTYSTIIGEFLLKTE